jgi:CBS domain-containing protein
VLVRDIMTTDIETVSRETTLDEAVERMLRNRTQYVVVLEDGDPSAFLTRRKALIAAYRTDAPLSDIPISGFARGFDHATPPDRTVLLSAGRMRQAETDCLPVVEDLEVVGVLTRDDIIEHVPNMRRETLEADRDSRRWSRR